MSQGSRPPAQISWFKDNRNLEKDKITSYSNETWTISTLIFNPTPVDNGVTIKCIASNSMLPSKIMDDHLKLNVVYSPVVTLTLGSTLNPHDIKEGDDVYFECNVRANPREHRISWYHNDRPVTQNMSSGIIVSTRSLVLQKVTKNEAGEYSCRAANSRGETSSEIVKLRVQYAPVCMDSSPRVVGAALDEALRVRCLVNADPADVSFLWQFNNSGESFNVSPARFATLNGSELRYMPASDRDYGALTCRGTNVVGSQLQPCVFQIVPAARPSPPRNCSIMTNETNWIEGPETDHDNVLMIRCATGYDGGLPQLIVLEALDANSGLLRFNITANETDGVALFVVHADLLWRTGSAIRLTVHSRNDKGASDRLVLNALAYQDPERRTDGGINLIVGMSKGIIWAIIMTVTVGACAATFAVFFLRKKRSSPPMKQPSSELQLNAGDGQYVVAYTLKPSGQAQPDILNPPAAGASPSVKCAVETDKNGTLQAWEASDRGRYQPNLEPHGLLSPPHPRQSSSSSNLTLSRREHLIAEEIPGPESCV